MKNFIVIALLLTLFVSCEHKTIVQPDDPDLVRLQKHEANLTLTSLNLLDRNGLSETIRAKDRLKTFENVNFLTSQPYQKVLRVFAKDKSGDSFSVITSYYPTGQIKQYLEVHNGRAHGRYLEWHQNGQKKLQSSVLGGVADLDEKSQMGWSFHETSYCWNEEGTLVASIPYSQGMLEGLSQYYHANGTLSEEIPYHKGEIDGESKVFDSKGILSERTSYKKGLKEGLSEGFWQDASLSWKEEWHADLLQEGVYFEKDGREICKVIQGSGKRCIFGDAGPSESHEYNKGKPEGEVLVFSETGAIVRRLQVKDGEKHGQETYYWPQNPEIPKISIDWVHDQIHGTVKTWYEDGIQESSREMSRNQKQGLLTANFRDGKLMMIEEYEKDRLVRGDYFKKHDPKPISQIVAGKGVATFYDADGSFRTRISYMEGKPVVEDLLSER